MAIPRDNHMDRLSVATPTAQPIPTPKAIPNPRFFLLFKTGYLKKITAQTTMAIPVSNAMGPRTGIAFI